MDRREFLKKSALAAGLIGVSVTTVTCGGSNNNSPTGPSEGADVDGTASRGHTHFGTIRRADLDAGAAVNVTFSGGSGGGHSHSVPLTAAQVQEIAAGNRVSFVFADSVHPQEPHSYTFN